MMLEVNGEKREEEAEERVEPMEEDVALIANEIVDEMLKKKRRVVLCKLDMEKAYDNGNWAFVN